ncbi:NPCBM/NEW2 domain-containing protein [Streptomyces cellulosae]
MSDRELNTVGRNDDAHAKHQAFKKMLREQFEMLRASGMSQNQFAKKYGYTSGRVSNMHRANADGTYFPRSSMLDELCRELAERCNVQDAALFVLRQRHRETLEALCAVDQPHHIHLTMLTELRMAEVVAELAAKVSSDQLALSHAIAERDALHEDRDDQRQRAHALTAQIEQLQRDLATAKAGKQQAVFLRDRASEKLDRLLPDRVPNGADPSAELGAFHGQHPLVSAQYRQPAKRDPSRVFVWVGAVGGAFVAVFVAGIFFAPLINDKASSDDNGRSSGKATDVPPPSTPSREPSDQQSTGETASPNTPTSAPKPLQVGTLNFTGDNWVQGSWTLGGKKYEKSLAWVNACDSERSVVISLPDAYHRFTAQVGLDEPSNDRDHEYVTDFDVYADLNQDKKADSDEKVASRGVTFDKPATIDTDNLQGARQIILTINTHNCGGTPLVWGNPKVS